MRKQEAGKDPKRRLVWPQIVARAAAIVRSYDTGVTLRQLFYRLVAEQLLPNTVTAYKALSSRTAEARRSGAFPALIDRTRTIHRYQSFASPASARAWLRDIYRRDRTENQHLSLYLGVEKNGIVEQLEAWFGEFGIPIVALGGYSSQSYVDEIAADVEQQGRAAALIYAGDFDPSGEDIERDFRERAGCFAEVVRVALTAEQVEEFDLPPLMGKASDSRAKGFIERHGQLVQVELDALPPDILRRLYAEAIEQFWDKSAFQQAVAQERSDLQELAG
ncbi:MAG: hypothetical protein FJ290_25585 [Planctomycetes bacterium]|nr:hypothetical protein [Planctomycetota bacterium]